DRAAPAGVQARLQVVGDRLLLARDAGNVHERHEEVGERFRRVRGACGRMHGYRVPVWPKPPAPRALAPSDSASTHSARGTLWSTSCAIRSPRATVNGAGPRFWTITRTSPR